MFPSVRTMLLAVLLLLPAGALAQQQVNMQTPLRTVGDAFFEQVGTSWSLGGRNWFLRVGGAPAVPPFGGGAGNQGAGLAGGVGFGGGGVNGGFNFTASQGFRRSNVMQSGNLTVMNGYPGFVSDTSQSPFVIGVVPVVGDAKLPWKQQMSGEIPKQTPLPPTAVTPTATSPRASARAEPRNEFAADPGLLSIAELREQRAATDAARRGEFQQQLAKARDAATAGKSSVARIYYQMALRRADEASKPQILAELERLSPNR